MQPPGDDPDTATKLDLVPPLGQQVLVVSQDWRSPIIDFIINNKSSPDKKEHEKLARRGASYVVVGDTLYCKSATASILAKCVSQETGKELLDSIHSGVYGNHASAATLVGNALRSGFYWPTALADIKTLVQHYTGCQFFAKDQHLPAQALRTIPPS